MNPLAKLFGYYETYHAHGRPLLKYIGIVGALAYVVFYLIRFTKPNPRPFDDVAMRAVVVVLFALLAARDHWPSRLKKFYLPYSYAALIFCMPFFNVYFSLERQGGIPAISNCFIALSFLVMLTDWRNTIVMLVIGIGSAGAIYFSTHTGGRWPPDLLAQLPAYLLILIGGGAFKLSEKQIDAEKSRLATALAGSIAHEMRNPLGRIRHNLENMQQALPPPSTSARTQALAASQVDALYRQLADSEMAVKRGLQVIAMTLDEVSAKPLDTGAFSYLSAAESTQKAIQEYVFESDNDRRRVSVQIIEDFSFRADETAYLFVLFNLIKNALYYLALDPAARVTITIVDHQVRVHDTGPGVAPEAVARLFQPFSSVGKSGGTGLGLAYCRRVMLAFGGDIECESVLGHYTQFTLRFPQISTEESRSHQVGVLARARAAFAGKRLLIVDDDAAQRMTTCHKLAPLEAQIDQAADGQRALEALSRQRYDLVLLDLNMPVMDGYAVAEKIRQGAAPENRDVRIVAYTSEPAQLAGVKIQKAGMDAFVSKPCAQLALVQALHHALDHPRVQPDALLAGHHVLLADDNPYNRKAVAAYLKHAGAVVLEVSHGEAVLEQLQSSDRWDVILMDINMPGMNGLETTQAIRASTMRCNKVPIIALTAHSDQAILAAARAAGMNGFITKPVAAAELYQTLGELARGGGLAMPTVPPARTDPTVHQGRLLDLERLESYRRMGMLEELLSDYMPEIGRLVERLEGCVARQDLPQALDVLHSLLGMSGEAGGAALYQLVRSIYVPMVETHSWPGQPGWLEQISALTAQTHRALNAHTATQAAS